MEALECLHTRRSVRQYTDEPVSEEQIKIMLDAAMIAPSAGNAQPWHFIVVRGKEILREAAQIHPYVGMAAKAPLAVLVCGNTSEEKFGGYWVQDCTAATQNLLLAAHALGLGAVWTGVYPMEERVAACKNLFKLPENVMPLGLLVIGHTNEKNSYKSRYNADKVHQERW